jgi:hypothetical protein
MLRTIAPAFVDPAYPVHTKRPEPTYLQLRAKCKALGHNIVDNSYGGPDSGCVDVYCTRCGFSHHVTLY